MAVFVNKKIIGTVYGPRPAGSKKGDFGRILFIGGSYTGAPALAALAALRAGADVVKVAAPWKQADVIAGFSPNLITIGMDSSHLEQSHVKILLELAKDADVVSIGSGLGKESQPAAMLFMGKVEKPMVVDAEAIPLLKGLKKEKVIVTPHAAEFEALTGEKLEAGLDERISLVEKYALTYGTIILKGPADIISNGRKTSLNKSGNPYMTVGGTGDTLAGICASLLAQKADAFHAACAAAYINGAAGDLAAARLGSAMLATDLIEEIASVVNSTVK